MDRTAVIKTENLTKKYGENIAVNNLNLEIYEGEVFGLLGPNGAGKTTTILMLMGMTEPTSGTAYINGNLTTKDTLKIKRIVGYMPDRVGFYDDMTARENLRFTGRLNGLDTKTIEDRINELLERVGLSEVGDKKVGTYSRGMKQRLGIADTLMKDPKIMILDEPTQGLDPEGINEMLGFISDLARTDKRTILVSSHLLHQMQKICDRVGIFIKGKLLAAGPISTLGDRVLAGQELTIEMNVSPVDDKLISLVKAIDKEVRVDADGENVVVKSTKEVRKDILKILYENNYELLYLKQSGRDLDDIYSRYFAGEGVKKDEKQ
ncbi:MAG: ABC transporter ATP-binding protein [Clostridiaceae bacterium]|nr:ABC transporter ATP-binding protein [Clostridiaceae bacterium]